MPKFITKNKKGAASFYVVAFSTLILVIIAASFIAIILSEVNRTSNDDLAQSAYDSAMAGVEDAKLAYFNYQNCVSQGATKDSGNLNGLTCGSIMRIMEDAKTDPNINECDMTALILGREVDDENGVIIRETKAGGVENNMSQAYTCVKISTKLNDYRGTISPSNPMKVVRVKLEDMEKVKDIKSIELSWYSNEYNGDLNYNNFKDGMVMFPQVGGSVTAPTPPMVALTMIQTADNFSMKDFDVTRDGRTNRGTVFLVPTGDINAAAKKVDDNYLAGYNNGKSKNLIGSAGLAKSNDKTSKNLPYAVYCGKGTKGEDFVCNATIELPEPVGGTRNSDSLIFALSLPYGKPTTDFAMKFCPDGTGCSVKESGSGDGQVTDNSFTLDGMQIDIDSTGRANDLFRRVETRLESSGGYVAYPRYAVEADGLEKNFVVPCEYNFKDTRLPAC